MKAGTHNHLKTKRLKRLLGVPLYRAVGILETLWLLCIDCCDEGDIGKFSDDEIADYLEWDGDASELVRALSDSGWTDPDADRRLVVHDWLEHCPEFIRDRVRKRHARNEKASIKASDRRSNTTYDQSDPDKPGQTRTNAVADGACPVYGNSIQGNSIPTNSIQGNVNTCPETKASSGPMPPVDSPVLEFPCDGKPKTWGLTESQLAQWRVLFPSLDVDAECRSALAWVLASAERRKTARGMQRFLVGWFDRSQNRGNGKGKPQQASAGKPRVKWTGFTDEKENA